MQDTKPSKTIYDPLKMDIRLYKVHYAPDDYSNPYCFENDHLVSSDYCIHHCQYYHGWNKDSAGEFIQCASPEYRHYSEEGILDCFGLHYEEIHIPF
jgi:hypothetical protein